MYNWLPVGKKNYDINHIPCCPCCGLDNETVNHLFQCPHPKMAACRNTAYDAIKKYLTDCKVPQQLSITVLSLMKHFCDSPTVTPMGTPITQPILDAALSIGVQYFIRGFLPCTWITAAKAMTNSSTTEIITAILHSQWKLLFFPL